MSTPDLRPYEDAFRQATTDPQAGRLDRYRRALADPPPPRAGLSHRWLLSTANYAALAGVDSGEAARDISAAIPRKSARDVQAAVRRAYTDHTGTKRPWVPMAPERRRKPDTGEFWWRTLERWPEDSDPICELWERSPTRIDWPPEEDARRVLATLYEPGEHLFIGGTRERGKPGGNIRTAAQWLAYVDAGGTLAQHWIPNPLTGAEGRRRDGKTTRRGDACVAAHRFAVVEFDAIPQWQQASFLLSARLPLAAVIDSGGKSLHAWVYVDCADAAAWDRDIRGRLFPQFLEPLGADGLCKNPARVSRAPGALRPGTGRRQRILYLDSGRTQ